MTIVEALQLAGGPVTREELVPHLSPRIGVHPGDSRTPHQWGTPARPVGASPIPRDELPLILRLPPEVLPPRPRPPVAWLSQVSGVEVQTFADVLDAMLALGLLVEVHSPGGPFRLSVTPYVPWVWATVDLGEELDRVQAAALEAGWRYLAPDLRHLMRWAPEGRIQASTRRMATRLAVSAEDVGAALVLLAIRGVCTVDPPLPPPGVPIDPDLLLTVTMLDARSRHNLE